MYVLLRPELALSISDTGVTQVCPDCC